MLNNADKDGITIKIQPKLSSLGHSKKIYYSFVVY
jgi:hypothetical protein